MSAPAARDRRALAVGSVVVAGLLVLGRGGPTWWRWVHERRAAAAEAAAAHARAEAAVRNAGAVRDSAAARAARVRTAAGTLLPGATPAAAGAALTERLADIAAAAGVRLGPVDLRPPAPWLPPAASIITLNHRVGTGPGAGHPPSPAARPVPVPATFPAAFVRVAARTDLTGDVRGLAFFLAALERGDGRIRVREFTVTQPDPGASAGHAEALRATLTIEALALNTPLRDDAVPDGATRDAGLGPSPPATRAPFRPDP